MKKSKGIFRTRFSKGKTKLYAKRNPDGTFKDIQVVKKAMKLNNAKKAKATVKPGYGFRGDIKKKNK